MYFRMRNLRMLAENWGPREGSQICQREEEYIEPVPEWGRRTRTDTKTPREEEHLWALSP